MNVRELRYLAELVQRDGDERLQNLHGILRRADLANRLKMIADAAEKEPCSVTHVAVYRDVKLNP